MSDPSAHILPRDLHFAVDRHAERAWLQNDVLQSIIVDSLAVMLPVGERYFIRSLRHFEERIPDAFIRLGISGYAAQEAYHTREHEAYNAALRSLGYDTQVAEDRLRALLPQVSKQPMKALLITCAIEHITYSLSRVILDDPRLMADANPAYRALWAWHALEEVEHAQVALAVLAAAGGGRPAIISYVARCLAFNLVLTKFLGQFLTNVGAMARSAGIETGWRMWARTAWLQLGKPGFLRRGLPHILAYYLPGYGRGSSRDAAVVAKARAQLATLLAERTAAA